MSGMVWLRVNPGNKQSQLQHTHTSLYLIHPSHLGSHTHPIYTNPITSHSLISPQISHRPLTYNMHACPLHPLSATHHHPFICHHPSLLTITPIPHSSSFTSPPHTHITPPPSTPHLLLCVQSPARSCQLQLWSLGNSLRHAHWRQVAPCCAGLPQKGRSTDV